MNPDKIELIELEDKTKKKLVNRRIQKTTPIKIPTQAELFMMQFQFVMEKMLAKKVCGSKT